VLFFKVTQDGLYATKVKAGLVFSTGAEFEGLNPNYFSSLPWTYENTNDNGSVTKIKFIKLSPVINGSFSEMYEHGGVILTAPLIWGLCVQCITDVDGNETWGIFLGTATGHDGDFLFAYNNNGTLQVERRNLERETIITTHLPNAIFSVPLPF
jgi:hypothetical protein